MRNVSNVEKFIKFNLRLTLREREREWKTLWQENISKNIDIVDLKIWMNEIMNYSNYNHLISSVFFFKLTQLISINYNKKKKRIKIINF